MAFRVQDKLANLAITNKKSFFFKLNMSSAIPDTPKHRTVSQHFGHIPQWLHFCIGQR